MELSEDCRITFNIDTEMTIALVTEGISEYRITKHILTKYFKGYNEDIDINQMPPKLTEDEKKQADCGTKGGWVEVLKYCENQEELESIVQSLSNI